MSGTFLFRCILCASIASSLSACSTVRDTTRAAVIAPLAAFAWTMDQVAPLPEGPAAPNSGGSMDLYAANGQRLGYGIQRADGSVDYFRADSSRLGYSSGGRTVIAPGKR
ncbi:MAG: hypothetical protein WCI75_12185 [candidate division NC10 bacterium]